MGDRTGPIYVMAWQRTLGDMVFHRALLAQSCENPLCRAWVELDVKGMATFRGEQTTLWDCRPDCPRCGAPSHYMASLGHGTPYRALATPAGRQVYGLEGYANDDVPPEDPVARRRAFLRSFGLTKRDVHRLKRLAEAVRPGWSPAALTDLDVPVRVVAVHKDEKHQPNGERLGEWGDAVLLFWRMTTPERDKWERRRSLQRG